MMKIRLVGIVKFWFFRKKFKISIIVDENNPEYPIVISDSGKLPSLFVYREDLGGEMNERKRH